MEPLLTTKYELKSNPASDFLQVYDQTVAGLASTLELRDKETRGHADRVTALTENLARKLGFAEKELVDIRRGALLHDIGKIGIPDSILFKPNQLTDEEWVIMKKHPEYAYELLSQMPFLRTALDIPYCHHEHWDGSGYPRRLCGEQIPEAARMFTIIDVWDALSSDRCYRPAWQRQDIVSYLVSQSGKLFDPQILDGFLGLIDGQNKAGWNWPEQYAIQKIDPNLSYPGARFSVCRQ
ncbi:MAG: HD-GYP domain-containing protein [Anaerolineaceae bacterium]|nr:HD-GYP domain-containing protein [Anaerolineaceae bacterium]